MTPENAMSAPCHLGETQRNALLAIYHSPSQQLVRGTGGWWTTTDTNGRTRSFSARTVHLMSNAWLVDMPRQCADRATLTRKGLDLAKHLSADPTTANAA